MKTTAISGWSTRLHAACMAAACALALALAMPAVKAQEATAAPTAAEAPAEAAPATADAATATDAAPAATTAAEAVPTEAAPAETEAEAPAPTISKPDTVWVLVSAALVIFMTLPGLALFYGGLVRSKNVLSILIQNLAVFSLVAVLWALYGYSLAFTEGNAFIGGTDRVFLKGVRAHPAGPLAHPAPRLGLQLFGSCHGTCPWVGAARSCDMAARPSSRGDRRFMAGGYTGKPRRRQGRPIVPSAQNYGLWGRYCTTRESPGLS